MMLLSCKQLNPTEIGLLNNDVNSDQFLRAEKLQPTFLSIVVVCQN